MGHRGIRQLGDRARDAIDGIDERAYRNRVLFGEVLDALFAKEYDKVMPLLIQAKDNNVEIEGISSLLLASKADLAAKLANGERLS